MDSDWLRHYLMNSQKPPMISIEWQADLWDEGEDDGDS